MKSLKQWLSDLQSDYRLVNKLHLLYVLVIFFNSFTFGITVTIFGVSMEDIRMLYGSGPKVMPLMMISQSGGYVLGTLIGPLYRWLNRQLVMATFALVLAFTTTFIPLYNPILVAFAALALQGVCMGVYASSFQIWFKQMFTGRLNTLLNVNQLCYGLGTAAAPIIAASYLFGSKQVETGERRRSVMIPFVITGVLQATAAAVLYLLFLTNRYYEPVEEEEKEEKKKRSFGANQQSKISSSSRLDHPHPHSLDECNNNNNNIYCLSTETMVHPSYSSSQATLSFSSIAESKDDSSSSRCAWRKTKLAMCTLVLALYYTSENGYLPYCSTMWQNLPIELSPADAAHVQTVLSVTYTAGPAVTAFVALKLSPDVIVGYHFAFLLTGLALLYFGQMNMVLIYAGSGLIGYGMSAMVATMYAFADRHFTLNNRVTTCFSLTNGVFFLSISAFLTHFTMSEYPNILFIIVFGYIASSLLLFTALRIWITIK